MPNPNPTQDNKAQKDDQRLLPPENGVTVRMYRIGHGDCFLLAFPGESKDKPVYVLIDCGYKPGSPQKFVTPKTKQEKKTQIAKITNNIRLATGGRLDVAVITHEHQDHVNGITETNFKGIAIAETWLAWTEDPDDEIANGLRTAFNDKLLHLVAARNRLAAVGSSEQTKRIDDLLEFELGWDSESGSMPAAGELLAAAGDPSKSMNKNAMKVFKDRSKTKYIRPHEEILTIPRAKDVRIFALGPPRDAEKIEDLDPQADETFKSEDGHKAAMSPRDYFLAAVDSDKLRLNLPFANQYRVPLDKAAAEETPPEFREFFISHYGQPVMQSDGAPGNTEEIEPPREVLDDAEWRRIDREWLYSAEQLALDMNDYTNNSSLVLAFELGQGGKVLLFAADAQRGNWVSWGDKAWVDGDRLIKASDLLAHTVLYKVGHHGSHNATLNGKPESAHPSLGWMAQGSFAKEFTAMITAVRAWAETQKGWDHPLKAIKDALMEKAHGRIFQTDTDLDKMAMHGGESADWDSFTKRACCDEDQLYFDYTITS
jgi:beta-lactamase superfamily II metal-dependent hydrolase